MAIQNILGARAFALACALAPLLVTAAVVPAKAATFKTIYSFPDALGASPAGGLYRDASGALYGTTLLGGTASADCPQGCGMVFKLKPPSAGSTTWTRTTLHKFAASEGTWSYATLRPGFGGALYGASSFGGAANKGSIYQLTPPASGNVWTFKVIRQLGGAGPGSNPYGDLLIDGNGVIFGMTSFSGSGGGGTVFKLTPPAAGKTEWTTTVLFAFNGTNGRNGQGGLVAAANGALYGVTSQGGSKNLGVLFRLTPPASGNGAWFYRILHHFAGGTADGATPYGTLVLRNGVLYGTTSAGGATGGGTIFSLKLPTPASAAPTYKVLHSMTAATEGTSPATGLTVDGTGTLYGSNYLNGTGNQGTLFKLVPPPSGQTVWTFSVIRSFGGSPDGDDPTGVLLRTSNGYFYGTTQYGGANDKGMVFIFKP